MKEGTVIQPSMLQLNLDNINQLLHRKYSEEKNGESAGLEKWLTTACNGVWTPPFLFIPHPSYQGTLHTENSHTPPFSEILSRTVLGITLKLHLQESRHNLKSAICACSILIENNLTRDLFWLFASFSGCPYFSGFS